MTRALITPHVRRRRLVRSSDRRADWWPNMCARPFDLLIVGTLVFVIDKVRRLHCLFVFPFLVNVSATRARVGRPRYVGNIGSRWTILSRCASVRHDAVLSGPPVRARTTPFLLSVPFPSRGPVVFFVFTVVLRNQPTNAVFVLLFSSLSRQKTIPI